RALQHRAQSGQDQQEERDRGEQRVEGQRAGEEGDVVLVGCLEGSAEEASDRAIPPAQPELVQATGSSSSSPPACRRLARASATRRSSSSRAGEPPVRLDPDAPASPSASTRSALPPASRRARSCEPISSQTS